MMDSKRSEFHEGDENAFVDVVSDFLSKNAPTKRGISSSEYIEMARNIWSSCKVDEVYAVKLLFDPLVQPEFQEESREDMFCVLVARVGHDGELIDAPPGYQPPNFPNVRLSHIIAGSPSGGQRPDPSRPSDYVLAYFDVLGFEALLNRVGLDVLNNIYMQLLDTALTPQSEEYPWGKGMSIMKGGLVPALMWSPIQTAYFSDSLLLWVPYHPQDLPQFLERCSLVFCQALQMGLPIRGAVTVGEAVLNKEGNIFLGHPLIEAVRLEAKLNWIGVALGVSVKSAKFRTPIPPHAIFFYKPPMKEGGDELFSDLVLDWPRVWRETRSESASGYLRALCTPDLPELLQQRYLDTILFYEHSNKNQNWCIPEGWTRIKVWPKPRLDVNELGQLG